MISFTQDDPEYTIKTILFINNKYASMKSIFVTYNNVEHEIIENLHSTFRNKRKGEEDLFCKYSYFIKNGMKRYSIDEDDAFNAYSDAVLACINSILNKTFETKFEANCSLKTYLYQIFHHKCVDVVRRKSRPKNILNKSVPMHTVELRILDNSKSIIEKIIIRSDFDKVKQKLNQLSDSSKQALLLSAQGYTDKEIALELKFKTADVVKTTRLRCLKKLYQSLKHIIQTPV